MNKQIKRPKARKLRQYFESFKQHVQCKFDSLARWTPHVRKWVFNHCHQSCRGDPKNSFWTREGLTSDLLNKFEQPAPNRILGNSPKVARFNKVFKWKKAKQQDKQFISVPSPSCPWFFNYIQLSLIPPLLIHFYPFPYIGVQINIFLGVGGGGILFKFLSDHSLTLLADNSFSHLPFFSLW